jgi:hypothetical protein
MNTGQIHHRFTRADLMLKVFAQAPLPARPAEGPCHDPPARAHHTPLGGRGPTANLQSPAAGLLDPGHAGFIAPSGPAQLQAAPAVVETPLDRPAEGFRPHFASGPLRSARPLAPDPQEPPPHLPAPRPFAPIDWLVDLRAALFAACGRLGAWAVDPGRTGLGLPPGLLADRRDRHRVELRPHPAVAPAPVISLDRLPRGKGRGQQSPRLSTAHEREDRLDDRAVRPGTRAAPPPCGQCEQRGKAAPLCILEIGWVRTAGMFFHPPRLSAPFSKRSLRAPHGLGCLFVVLVMS